MKSVHPPTLVAIHVMCAGGRVVRRVSGVVGQDHWPAYRRVLARSFRSSRQWRWTGSNQTGRWCGIFRNSGHVIISDRLIGSFDPAGR